MKISKCIPRNMVEQFNVWSEKLTDTVSKDY